MRRQSDFVLVLYLTCANSSEAFCWISLMRWLRQALSSSSSHHCRPFVYFANDHRLHPWMGTFCIPLPFISFCFGLCESCPSKFVQLLVGLLTSVQSMAHTTFCLKLANCFALPRLYCKVPLWQGLSVCLFAGLIFTLWFTTAWQWEKGYPIFPWARELTEQTTVQSDNFPWRLS